jgi:RNA polymerase sigma-70 factor (ECF subfamily)
MTTHEQPRERDDLDQVRQLVVAARRGERPAFDELVRRTFVDTYTLALRLTADEEDARDVVQEAYLRAWKGLPKFRGDAQFSTWMYRITANAAYSAVKRRRRHRAEALDAMIEEPVELHVDGQPEDAVESALLLARLAAALDQLPPKLRVLVVLKDVYGMSHEEIAEELGISIPAAKVRLHRGRKRLRDLLDEDEPKPGQSSPDGQTNGSGWARAV